LVLDKKIFNFYFFNYNNKLQFFLAKDSNDQLLGILGYITNKQFDNKIQTNSAWLSIWCSKKNAVNGVGIMLLNKLEKSLKLDFVASLGVGNMVLPIYKRLGYKIGKMDHFIKELKTNKQKEINKNKVYSGIPEKKINFSPKIKNLNYLKKKYSNNKYYKYYFYTIKKNNKIITVLVGRIISYKKNKIFRIIDLIGSLNGIEIFGKYNNLYIDKKINFIDILCKNPFMQKNIKGFFKSNNQRFLPIYFEPLIDKYSEKNLIFKRIKNVKKDFLILTGDCDQERPNKIKI